MARSKSISERAIAARPPRETGVTIQGETGGDIAIAGLNFRVAKKVTVPVLKNEQPVAFTVQGPMYMGKQLSAKDGKAPMAPATLIKVFDLVTKTDKVYVVPAVLKSVWIDDYDGFDPDPKSPNHGRQDIANNEYVGKHFAVRKLEKPEGKRHRELQVVEIFID